MNKEPAFVYAYRSESGIIQKECDVYDLFHPLYFLLHDEPNPEMTSFVFRETLMTHLLLYGNAYAQIIRNGRGEIVSLYPLMPGKMEVDRNDKGQLYYRYQKSSEEGADMPNSSVILMPEDVLHIPGLGFDGLVGYSPIAMAKMPSVLQLRRRNTARSFTPTAHHRPACWNIRVS